MEKGDHRSENDLDGLAERFETHRGRLRALAYRMLGSLGDADDAVQEAWLRLARVDARTVENLGGWLTTVVSRVCLDALRSRETRGDDRLSSVEEWDVRDRAADPEQEALLIDSVGRALLVVLNTLSPTERVAFVLHDLLGATFSEIGTIVDRSPVAAKKLASRARHKVQGAPAIEAVELARHRRLVEAFVAASRAGDVDAVVAVLAPDVVRRADRAALARDRPAVVRGARRVAEEIVLFGRNATFAEVVLINGAVGVVVAPHGRLRMALSFAIEGERIAEYELVADRERLRELEIAVIGALADVPKTL